MGIYVNSNNESFKSALRSRVYVDKSMLIEFTNSVLGSRLKWIYLTRFRFGDKSLAASRLVAYL